MILSITQEHIDKGIRENCKRCPIALAVADTGEDTEDIYVYYDAIRVGSSKYLWEAELPEVAINFIRDFDEGRDVKPFEFEIKQEYENSSH